jgi:septal ring factor EnvC (AmiA/AmiB activator)
MSIRRLSGAALTCALILLPPAGSSSITAQDPKQEHQHQAMKPSAGMPAMCQAMMAEHNKMMAEVKAADERLDGLVARMTEASGQAKVDATAAVVSEIVAQRKTMRERMMKMQEGTMSHMMAHMQAGKDSMAMCPMMKMGGMKH